MAMGARNTARWTRGRNGEWQLLVHFGRHWEAPPVGEGYDTVHRVYVQKKGDKHAGTPTEVRLTSRVFYNDRDRKFLAFAEENAT